MTKRRSATSPSPGSSASGHVIGLDLSLTGSGLVVLDASGRLRRARLLGTGAENQAAKFVKAQMIETGAGVYNPGDRKFYGTLDQRIDFILRKIRSAVKKYPPLVVGIEGYAFSKSSPGLQERCEMTGVIKRYLWEKEILTVTPAPTQVKLWATGNGNAKKPEMISAALKDGFPYDEENMVDAYWVAEWCRFNVLDLIETT